MDYNTVEYLTMNYRTQTLEYQNNKFYKDYNYNYKNSPL